MRVFVLLAIAAIGCQRRAPEAAATPPAPPAADPHAFLAAPVETAIVPPPADALAGPPRSAIATPSGLHTQILEPSASPEMPRRSDTVVMAVELWDAHGKLLDSYTTGDAFTLADGMPGMIEGILLMHRGEKRRLWIDEAHQGAYELAAGTIVCDVELVDIVR